MVKFVGIANTKGKIILRENRPLRRERVQIKDFLFDAERHIRFLLDSKCEGFDYRKTLYFNFLRDFKSEAVAIAKAERFLGLFSLMQSGEQVSSSSQALAASPHGIRLDGSHRAACLFVMGETQIDVNMHDWNDQKEGSLELIECRLKQKRHLDQKGVNVRVRSTNEPVLILYSDFVGTSIPGDFETWYAVKGKDREFYIHSREIAFPNIKTTPQRQEHA